MTNNSHKINELENKLKVIKFLDETGFVFIDKMWRNKNLSMKFDEDQMILYADKQYPNIGSISILFMRSLKNKALTFNLVSYAIMFWKEINSYKSIIIHNNPIGRCSFITSIILEEDQIYCNPFSNSEYITRDITKYNENFLPSAVDFPLVFTDKNNKYRIHFMNLLFISNGKNQFAPWNRNSFPSEYEPYSNIILLPKFLPKIDNIR